ncbi:hypothetical protein V8C86DRAFT_2466292 [Haematococcus lacustris]
MSTKAQNDTQWPCRSASLVTLPSSRRKEQRAWMPTWQVQSEIPPPSPAAVGARTHDECWSPEGKQSCTKTGPLRPRPASATPSYMFHSSKQYSSLWAAPQGPLRASQDMPRSHVALVRGGAGVGTHDLGQSSSISQRPLHEAWGGVLPPSSEAGRQLATSNCLVGSGLGFDSPREAGGGGGQGWEQGAPALEQQRGMAYTAEQQRGDGQLYPRPSIGEHSARQAVALFRKLARERDQSMAPLTGSSSPRLAAGPPSISPAGTVSPFSRFSASARAPLATPPPCSPPSPYWTVYQPAAPPRSPHSPSTCTAAAPGVLELGGLTCPAWPDRLADAGRKRLHRWWASRTRRRVWRAWRRRVAESACQARQQQRAARHAELSALGWAWARWRLAATVQLRGCMRRARAHRIMQRRTAAKVFEAWAAFMDAAQHDKAKLRKASHHFLKGCMTRAWASWKAVRVHRQLRAAKAKRMARWRCRYVQFIALHRWVDWVSERKQRAKLLDHAASSRKARVQARVLMSWAQLLAERHAIHQEEQIKALHQDQEEAQAAVDQLEQQHCADVAELAAARDAQAAAEARAEDAERRAAARDAAAETATEEAQRALAAAQEEVQVLRQQLAACPPSLAIELQELQVVRGQLAETQDALTAALQAAELSQQEAEYLTRQLAQLEAEARSAAVAAGQHQEDAARLRSALEDMERRAGEYSESRVQELVREVETLHAAGQAARAEIAKLRAVASELTASKQAAAEEHATLLKNATNVQHQLQAEVDTLRADISELLSIAQAEANAAEELRVALANSKRPPSPPKHEPDSGRSQAVAMDPVREEQEFAKVEQMDQGWEYGGLLRQPGGHAALPAIMEEPDAGERLSGAGGTPGSGAAYPPAKVKDAPTSGHDTHPSLQESHSSLSGPEEYEEGTGAKPDAEMAPAPNQWLSSNEDLDWDEISDIGSVVVGEERMSWR